MVRTTTAVARDLFPSVLFPYTTPLGRVIGCVNWFSLAVFLALDFRP